MSEGRAPIEWDGTTRTERDSMGEMNVPSGALWGASTQRAVLNFPISGLRFPRRFIQALGFIKGAAAAANAHLGHLDGRTRDLARRLGDADGLAAQRLGLDQGRALLDHGGVGDERGDGLGRRPVAAAWVSFTSQGSGGSVRTDPQGLARFPHAQTQLLQREGWEVALAAPLRRRVGLHPRPSRRTDSAESAWSAYTSQRDRHGD